ncbi:hypothetical protein GCM10027289_01400 [Tsukamurella serpentis]
MTAITASSPRRARIASAAALFTAIAAGTTLAAPVASAAPVRNDLVLTAQQFPAGSTDYRLLPDAKAGKVGVTDDASPQCRGASDRLNAALAGSKGATAVARNGYSAMASAVLSPPITGAWRDTVAQCGQTEGRPPVPGDLARYNPVVITNHKDGRLESVEGFADVNGFTVDVYVAGLSATPANTDRFWQVFRAQVQKVQAGR